MAVDDIGENRFWLELWTRLIMIVLVITVCITIYNVVDRIGPVRPIVTMQYQAK